MCKSLAFSILTELCNRYHNFYHPQKKLCTCYHSLMNFYINNFFAKVEMLLLPLPLRAQILNFDNILYHTDSSLWQFCIFCSMTIS